MGHRGWKPCRADWDAIVAKNKPLTETLKRRAIALSASNKAADAKYAREVQRMRTTLHMLPRVRIAERADLPPP